MPISYERLPAQTSAKEDSKRSVSPHGPVGLRLHVERSQQEICGKRGAREGVTFTVMYRLEIGVAEAALIEKYHTGDRRERLMMEVPVAVQPAVASLLNGGEPKYTNGDIEFVLAHEDSVRSAVERLATYIVVCRDYGGLLSSEYSRR